MDRDRIARLLAAEEKRPAPKKAGFWESLKLDLLWLVCAALFAFSLYFTVVLFLELCPIQVKTDVTPILFAALVLSALSALVWLPAKASKWLVPLLTIGLAALAWFCRDWFWRGFQTLADGIAVRTNAYYGTDYGSWKAEPVSMELFFSALLMPMALYLGYFVYRRPRAAASVLPTVVIALLGLIVGRLMSISLAIIFVGIYFTFKGLETGKGTVLGRPDSAKQSMAWLGIGMIAISLFLWFVSPVWQNKLYEWQAAVRHWNGGEEGDEGLLYRRSEELDNQAPVYSGRRMLELSVSRYFSPMLYLKGFVGSVYEENTWLSVEPEDFTLHWDQQSSRSIQEYGYNRLQKTMPETVIRVRPLQDEESCAYVPYYSRAMGDWTPFLDSGAVSNMQEYTYNGYPDVQYRLMESGLIQALAGKEDPEPLYAGTQLRLQGAGAVLEALQERYRQFVYTLDLEVPEEVRAALEEMIAPILEEKGWAVRPSGWLEESETQETSEISGEESAEQEESNEAEESGETGDNPEETDLPHYVDVFEAAEIVEEILSGYTYRLQLPSVPEGEDYTLFFLSEMHEGFCRHFATAATLLFRTLNVPARYVSGYAVFEDNQGVSQRMYVQDRMAHAWTEVYVDGFGWFPLDFTPADETNTVYHWSGPAQGPGYYQEDDEEEEDDGIVIPIVPGRPGTRQEGRTLPWWSWLLLIPVLLTAFVTVILIRRSRILKKRRETGREEASRIADGTLSEEMQADYREQVLDLGRNLYAAVDLVPAAKELDDPLLAVRTACGDDRLAERFCLHLQEAQFSGRRETAVMYREAYRDYRQILRRTAPGWTRRQRLYVKYMKCWL